MELSHICLTGVKFIARTVWGLIAGRDGVKCDSKLLVW
jgi:hypothetical protein